MLYVLFCLFVLSCLCILARFIVQYFAKFHKMHMYMYQEGIECSLYNVPTVFGRLHGEPTIFTGVVLLLLYEGAYRSRASGANSTVKVVRFGISYA